MNVVDSSGWLEYFADSENAAIFAPVIGDSDHLMAPAICIYEVFKRILTQSRLSTVQTHIGDMYIGHIVDIDGSLARSAAQLSAQEKLPTADSLILAVVRAHNAVLWTQDEHFKGLAGVQYIEKPE